MRLTIPVILSIMLLQTIPIRLTAQKHFVRLDVMDSRCLLYMGYQNILRMPLLHPHDTINQYIFHAKAVGADIDYDKDGRMIVLPYQKYGHVDVYAELKGKYYYAGQFKFEGVPPPPFALQDETFVSTMGITKDDPKNTLPNKKNFDVASIAVAKMDELEIAGIQSRDLNKDGPSVIRVRIYSIENEQYNELHGPIAILSVDARVRKVNNNTFQITLPPGKRHCRLSVYFNDAKIEERQMSIGY